MYLHTGSQTYLIVIEENFGLQRADLIVGKLYINVSYASEPKPKISDQIMGELSKE